MEKRELKRGDVVQLNPDKVRGTFAGCFAQVEDPKPWGMQGWVAVVGGADPPRRAYVRATWDQMEFVGCATWIGE